MKFFTEHSYMYKNIIVQFMKRVIEQSDVGRLQSKLFITYTGPVSER